MIEAEKMTEGAAMTKHIALAAFSFAGIVTIWAVEAPAYGAQQEPETSSAQQGDKSQDVCIARRQREGLNTRFAASRCVNPNN